MTVDRKLMDNNTHTQYCGETRAQMRNLHTVIYVHCLLLIGSFSGSLKL